MNDTFHVDVPDLGPGLAPIRLTVWLVPVGGRFVAGDRLVELLAGEVTVELAACESGCLVERCVEEHAAVVVGEVIAVCRAA